MSTDNEIDVSKLEKLKMLFEDSFQTQLDLFLKNTEDYINGIGEAVATNNRALAEEFAHKMKSSTGLYGANKLAKLSEIIEHSDEAKFASDGKEIFEQIKGAFAQYKNFISSL